MAGIEAELKLLKFDQDIKDQKLFNVKLISLFNTEYDEIINDILNLKEDLFIDQIKEGVSLVLEDKYTDYCLTEARAMKLISKNIEDIKNKYRNDFFLINNAWSTYEKNSKKRLNKDSNIFLTGFRKHCINSEEYASHNCLSKEKDGEKNCRFIIVNNLDNTKEIKFVICENCKKVYYSSFILARCYKQYFYINMKNGLLTCLNKKCGFISKPNRILWTCCTCKKDFKSGAIPYNPLDIQVTKKLILQTILLRHKAHPKKMICGCKLNVFFTEFNHSKNCDGILYESELDDNTIIVCEKCKMITYIDRFIWTCPKCKKKFKNGIGENNNCIINDDIRDNYNSEEIVVDISDKNKYRKDKDKELNDIDSNKKNNSTPFPKHLNYASKRLKKYKLKQEKKLEEINNNNNNHNINNNIENEKKEEKKVISSGWKHRRYSSSHLVENTDTNKNKEEINHPKEENIINNEEVNNNKEEKKSFKKFRYREKGGSVLNLGGEEKLKEKKEIDIIDDKNNNQRYISPRNFRKKRFFFLNNNTKEENLSDKVEKETEEKESENKKPEPKKKEIEIKKNEENSSDSSAQSDSDDSSLSSDEKDEVDEKVQENKASPRFTRNFVKKKTCGIVLGETETEETQPPESPRKHKKKNAPQIQVKIAMSKIPGVSEHLFNHITKRMTAILNRVKIPVFNIDDYVFNKKLGEGGYAVIFSVFRKDDEEQKQFALKKIIAKTLTEIDKFTKEFEIMHNCIHENIMKIYGICIRILDQTTYALYVLMELSERDWDKDIKNHIAKKKLYSEKKLINILRQLTSALLFMKQNAKISHRDIKPQNVLIFNGVYKLADFGEAKKANEISEMNTLRGTELFMSPVLYSGLKHEKNDVNHDPYKSDIFSLGFCFLYAATLNFDLLYKVRDIYNSNMMNKTLEQNLKNKYSNTFIQILSKMLDTDESERFNFEELAEFVDNKYDKEGNLKEEENNNENFTDNKKGMNNALMNRIKKFKK